VSQQQTFDLDGAPVAYCEGGFAAKFDMDASDAKAVSYGDTVVLVVVARVGLPSFRETKEGDIVRVNKFEVKASKVADDKTGTELAEMFDMDVQRTLPYSVGTAAAASVAKAPQRTVPASSTAKVAPAPTNAPGATTVAAGPHVHDDALREFLEV
jgi:hypothetical protein